MAYVNAAALNELLLKTAWHVQHGTNPRTGASWPGISTEQHIPPPVPVAPPLTK